MKGKITLHCCTYLYPLQHVYARVFRLREQHFPCFNPRFLTDEGGGRISIAYITVQALALYIFLSFSSITSTIATLSPDSGPLARKLHTAYHAIVLSLPSVTIKSLRCKSGVGQSTRCPCLPPLGSCFPKPKYFPKPKHKPTPSLSCPICLLLLYTKLFLANISAQRSPHYDTTKR